ncbi:intercellular adhesion molecule 5 isoform X1 [Tachyglossus aculeatus]|uniref:intercellular adhesion molecule 5 isoform X1 n=1 Tax=Tachyglossus aculeatus TaxID=9261 RepID=UPI0018F6C2D3|nr:intercellular adhesion molecule 5 isoform X1 [Tachyglossus aculeatus]
MMMMIAGKRAAPVPGSAPHPPPPPWIPSSQRSTHLQARLGPGSSGRLPCLRFQRRAMSRFPPRPRWARLVSWGALVLGLVAGLGTEREPYWADLQPRAALVERGGALWLNCSTNCPRPKRGGLDTSLRRARGQRGPRWLSRELVDIREPESRPVCFFHCGPRVLQARALIRTFLPPEQVELTPPPAWVPVGENYTVDCRVPEAMPLENLTVALLQGSRELGRQGFPGKPPGTQNATATFTVLARREDHGTNVSCQAELDLRRLGLDLFRGRSASARLRTFQFKRLPWFSSSALSDSWLLEVGAATSVSCEAEVFPAGEAQVHLSLGGQERNPTVTQHGDRLTAEATVQAAEGPERELDLNCTVAVGSESRTARKTLTFYNFPPPELTLSERSPVEKTPVNVSCRARPGASVKLEGQPEQPPGQPAHLQLIAREEDDGRLLSCEATLSLKSVQLVKRQIVQLHVLHGPRMNASDCPGNWTWLEGTEQVLRCRARGNPPPTVQCVHAGIEGPFLPETPLRVTRAHAGTYRCTASSHLGTEARDVVVTVDSPPVSSPQPNVMGVHYCNATNQHGSVGRTFTGSAEPPPWMDESSCPSHQTWLEGARGPALTCGAWGSPPPRVQCARDGDLKRLEGLEDPEWLERGRSVSREDAGTYRCEATNARGSDARTVTVGVEYKPVVALLAATPTGRVEPGGNFTLTCRADGSPPAQLSWHTPPGARGSSLSLSGDNGTLSVAGAHSRHGGVYECMATNAHGHHVRRITVRVAGPWPWVAGGGAAGGAALLAGLAALVWYIKSAACKTGEYSVQEAESAGQAVGAGTEAGDEIYAIQLTAK